MTPGSRRRKTCNRVHIRGPMAKARDKFTMAASTIVEEHIRIHELTVIPHPDSLKDAIADELRNQWDDAIYAVESAIQTLRNPD